MSASPLTASSQFTETPHANPPCKNEKGLFKRALVCCWQLTKFFGGLGMIGTGSSLTICSCAAFTCGKCLQSNALFESLGDCCDEFGCGKFGSCVGLPLWYLGWKSMKSGWNGLTKD